MAIDDLIKMAIRRRKGRSPVEITPKRNQNVESDGDENITPIKHRCPETLPDEEVCNYTIIYVDPIIAQKRDGGKNFQWQLPNKDDLSLFTVLTSVIEATILAFVKTVNEGMPDPSQTIRELYGIRYRRPIWKSEYVIAFYCKTMRFRILQYLREGQSYHSTKSFLRQKK
ncbi:hypothetical protein K440DRAFT_642601 [Wilcoxina mikolae CBS 423.85]|nr:hypothetical protein K440DRAFT_642601 [Wilcoxina mikolae CBS 423.85]